VKALALLLVVGTAAAEEPDARARAEAHFEAGRGLYRVGNYSDALREFSAGYELVRLPLFLIDIAQCQRRLHKSAEALAAYRQYLAVSAPRDAMRPQVEATVAELTAELERAPPVVAPPPAISVAPRPPPTIVVAPRFPPRSRLRHLAWALPLGSALVVGIALGAYYGASAAACPVGIGCLDLRH
jgi:hypothetical protein